MKKSATPEQQIYRHIVDTLLPYADKQLELIKDKLTPGTTYTAAEIVKIVGLNKSDALRDEFIETELGTIAIASWNIFQQIRMCEKHAGLTGKKAHTWTVPDTREVMAMTSMSFGSKRQMKDLATLMKQRTLYEHEIIAFSLADGCLRPIINNYKYNSDDSRLKLQSIGYEMPQECSRLSFKISWQQLKEMYGECRLYIYKDTEPDLCCYLNPYHVRIVIENANGKCVSSNEVIPISEEYVEKYDAEFTPSYEDDYKPIKPKNIIETKHTEAVNNQLVSAPLEPSNNDHAIPISSVNETEKMQDAQDVSDGEDAPANILRRLEPPLELQDDLMYQKGIITYIPPTPEDRLRLLESERICSPEYPPDLFPDSEIYIEHSVKKLTISRN